jgi:REP element-mobilizing transposase RayT
VANSKRNPGPGNANLPIGASNVAGNANLPIGGLDVGGLNASQKVVAHQNAIQENGAPRDPVWHSRGYLPHFESAEATQHVTFHLADSLPQKVLLRLESDLKIFPAEKRDAERRKRVEAWIDAGHGSCVLRKPAIANMVQGSLLAFDSQRYRLLAWVVMPNHVHALFQPINGWTVGKIVASWKKFTARQIRPGSIPGNANLLIGGFQPSSPVWHREYWDRYIRNQRHFNQAIDYIHQNPVKAGLVATAESWRWSSAFPGNANLPIGVVFEKP